MSALPAPTLRRLPAIAAVSSCLALAAALLVGSGGTPIPAYALGGAALSLLLVEVGRRAIQMMRFGFGAEVVLTLLALAVLGAGWSVVVAAHLEYLTIFGLLFLVGVSLVVRPLLETQVRIAAGATPWQAFTGRSAGRGEGGGARPILREQGSLLLGVFCLLAAGRVATGTLDAYSTGMFGLGGVTVAFGLMGMLAAGAAGWFAGASHVRGHDHRESRGGALGQPRTTTERDEQVVAAHLHDSVLQTLALIQRSSTDPTRVGQLARQQERSLRAWLAGRDDTTATSLPGALRAAAQDVEDEHPGAVIEIVVVGTALLDRSADAMVRAAREAMRNAVRHAGSPVRVFLEIEDGRRELFVRDTGSGFSLDAVDEARRGVRDAIIGRMEHVGGTAEIESGPTGTDVILRSEHSGATPDDPFGGRT